MTKYTIPASVMGTAVRCPLCDGVFTAGFERLVHMTTKKKKRMMTSLYKKADRKISDITLQTLVRFFMVLGVSAFVCFALNLSGLAFSSMQSDAVQPAIMFSLPERDNLFHAEATEETWTMLELLEYDSWANFTAACCCYEEPGSDTLPQDKGAYSRIEVWQCLNGQFKQRVRQYRDVDGTLHNGLELRSMCNKSFAYNVSEPYYSRHFVVNVADGTDIESTEVARNFLW